MCLLYLKKPTINYKEKAILFVKEFENVNSHMAGSSNLDTMYNNYEEWLKFIKKLEKSNTCPTNFCPSYTYFLVRYTDDKIIGIINIRYNLNDWMLENCGHIGYSIRPSERRKGYNKINLYLALEKAKNINLNKVLLTADDNNIGSVKTILSLGGKLENKIFSYENNNVLMGRYWIDVNKSLDKYFNSYKNKIYRRE